MTLVPVNQDQVLQTPRLHRFVAGTQEEFHSLRYGRRHNVVIPIPVAPYEQPISQGDLVLVLEPKNYEDPVNGPREDTTRNSVLAIICDIEVIRLPMSTPLHAVLSLTGEVNYSGSLPDSIVRTHTMLR